MALSAARISSQPVEHGEARASLFKEDRPRKIDQFISFFGDGDRDAHESDHPRRDTFRADRWSVQ